MIVLKVLSSLLFVVATLLKFGLDYWWRDKRTKKHRRAGAAFLSVALLAGAVTSVAVLFESISLKRSRTRQDEQLSRIEDSSYGGLGLKIFVELYIGPNHPRRPRLSLSPEFPGIVAVWIDNHLDYPVYDLSVQMIHRKPEGGMSETASAFNTPAKNFDVLRSGEGMTFLLPADLVVNSNKPMISFDFFTHSRRGTTKQLSRFFLISNSWEYARCTIDLETSITIFQEASPSYPRDDNGEPVW